MRLRSRQESYDPRGCPSRHGLGTSVRPSRAAPNGLVLSSSEAAWCARSDKTSPRHALPFAPHLVHSSSATSSASSAPRPGARSRCVATPPLSPTEARSDVFIRALVPSTGGAQQQGARTAGSTKGLAHVGKGGMTGLGWFWPSFRGSDGVVGTWQCIDEPSDMQRPTYTPITVILPHFRILGNLGSLSLKEAASPVSFEPLGWSG